MPKLYDGISTTEAQRFMSRAVLVCGRTLQYVHCIELGLPPDGDYEKVNGDMNRTVNGLISHAQSHSWALCGPIIMSLK